MKLLGGCFRGESNVSPTPHISQNDSCLLLNLPEELFLEILKKLTVQQVLECKMVCRGFNDSIRNNFSQLPRPTLNLYASYYLPSSWLFSDWNMGAFVHTGYANVEGIPRRRCRKYDVKYTGGRLKITICSRTCEPKLNGRELEMFRDFFKKRGNTPSMCVGLQQHNFLFLGYSGRITEKPSDRDYPYDTEHVFRVKIGCWKNALNMCFAVLGSYGYRLNVQAGCDNESKHKPDSSAGETFFRIVEEFIRDQPFVLDSIEIKRPFARGLRTLMPLVEDTIRKCEDQHFHLYFQKRVTSRQPDDGIWILKFREPIVSVEPHTIYRRKKTGESAKQAWKFTAHLNVVTDWQSIVENCSAKTIRIDVFRNTLKFIPGILRTIVGQWYCGKRAIKCFIVDPGNNFLFDSSNQLDVLSILEDYSPRSLPKRKECKESYLIQTSQDYHHRRCLLISFKVLPPLRMFDRQGDTYGYILEELNE